MGHEDEQKDLPATGGGLDPSAFPQASQVGQDIPAEGTPHSEPELPDDLPAAMVEARRRARSLVRHAIAYVPRSGGRGATRHDSTAITKLEEALLWLSADDIL
jgi:hypothetical protein